MHRAYTTFDIKGFDEDRRIVEGIASTPTPDRGGDVMHSKGAVYALPMPFLWKHKEEIGDVLEATVTATGIHIKAQIAKIDEPGRLKDRLDEAWQSIKARLVRGLSIGWRPLDYTPNKAGGLDVKKWEWFELSAVTIPMNADATITAIKSVDAVDWAASGRSTGTHTPGATGAPVVKLKPSRGETQMKSTAEQIASFKATREQKVSELNEIMTKSAESGETLDAEQSQKYDGLRAEIATIDTHITRLEEFQEFQKASATAVSGTNPHEASVARGGASPEAPRVRVQPNEEPGIGFARAAMCKAASYLSFTKDGVVRSALEFAKERYPDNDRLHLYLKATVPAATTTHVTWAAPLVYATNLVDEFIEYLRPQTIIGKFGTNGIPSLTRTPFNVRVPRQISGGDAYWVGQGAAKPMTKVDFDSVTLGITKVATIAVITEELARLSSPSAEMRVRDALTGAVVQRIDTDFIDPAQSAVTDVNPASITNGLTALSPSGTTADAARADVAQLIKRFLDNNQDPSSLVLIMPTALALSLSVQVNSLGQPEFPGLSMSGGRLAGLPVITSQYAANQSGAGNLVIAVSAKEILLADDGQVTVDVSREASLQFLDNPTNSSATGTATTMVSLWQTNSIGLRAERFINWTKARSTAVVYMDDVNWGTIGSPA